MKSFLRTLIVLALVLVTLSGCEWIDSVVPTMPFNAPENLVNPNDPLNPANNIPPGAAKDLTLESRPNSLVVKWTNPEDVDLVSGEITWVPTLNPGQTAQVLTISTVASGTSMLREITGLPSGTSYDITLRLRDKTGLWSYPRSVTGATLGLPDNSPPAEVSNLKVELDDTQVELLWTDPTDNDLAEIVIVVDGVTFSAEKTSGAVAGIYNNRYLLYNMVNGRAYGITIRTKDTAGNLSTGLFRSVIPQIPSSGIKLHFKNNEFTFWDPEMITVQFYNQTGTGTQITGFPGRMTRTEENKWFGYVIPNALSATVKFFGVYQNLRENTQEKVISSGLEWWFVPDSQSLGEIRGQWLNYDPEKLQPGLTWMQVGFKESAEAYVHVTLTDAGSYTLEWADSADGPYPLTDTVDVKVSLLAGAGTTAQVIGGIFEEDVGYPGYPLALSSGKYWIRLAPYYDVPVTGTARVRIYKN